MLPRFIRVIRVGYEIVVVRKMPRSLIGWKNAFIPPPSAPFLAESSNKIV